MNNDPVITQEEIEHNRYQVIQALLHNPMGFDKIQATLSDGCNGRCAGGVGLEALGHNLAFTPDADDLDRLPASIEGLYTAFEYLVGYADPDDGLGISEFIWAINDKDGTTFKDVGLALEKLWFNESAA